MLELILAAAFLLASHFGIASTGLRPLLIARLGTGTYLGVYSALALAAFAWLILAYTQAPLVILWTPPPLAAWIPVLVLPFAILLLVGGLTTPNPTAVGASAAKKEIAQPSGVLRITRHPVMWSFALWGLSHMVANGELAAWILFATVVALALIGTQLIDARYQQRLGHVWQLFATSTSNLPFGAIVGGRQRLVLREIGAWRLIQALGVYVILILIHPWMFGASPLPPH
jgi:uncharacterized membrane protein